MPERQFTLDASVAAKWFNSESLIEEALRVRNAFAQGKIGLLAPAHMPYEVGNAIWKNKLLTRQDAAAAIKNLIDFQINLIDLTPKIAGEAMTLARESGVTFYDAAYITVADQFDAQLVSADERILAVSKGKRSMHLKDFQI